MPKISQEGNKKPKEESKIALIVFIILIYVILIVIIEQGYKSNSRDIPINSLEAQCLNFFNKSNMHVNSQISFENYESAMNWAQTDGEVAAYTIQGLKDIKFPIVIAEVTSKESLSTNKTRGDLIFCNEDWLTS